MNYIKIIRDKKTGETFEAYNFGGPDIFQVDGYWIYGLKNLAYTKVTKTDTNITLEPFNLTIELEPGATEWEIIDYGSIGTCDWRITVKNKTTKQEISGVYPFNIGGEVYQLPCGTEWVMASCGGINIEAGDGDPICYTLIGTGEVIRTFSRTTVSGNLMNSWIVSAYTNVFETWDSISSEAPPNFNSYVFPSSYRGLPKYGLDKTGLYMEKLSYVIYCNAFIFSDGSIVGGNAHLDFFYRIRAKSQRYKSQTSSVKEIAVLELANIEYPGTKSILDVYAADSFRGTEKIWPRSHYKIYFDKYIICFTDDSSYEFGVYLVLATEVELAIELEPYVRNDGHTINHIGIKIKKLFPGAPVSTCWASLKDDILEQLEILVRTKRSLIESL